MKIKQMRFVIALVASLLSVGLQAAERIISADAGVTAVLRALQLEKELVGIDVTSTQPAGTPLPVVGYHRQLATEGLLALKPSLLVGGEHMGPPATLLPCTAMPANTRGWLVSASTTFPRMVDTCCGLSFFDLAGAAETVMSPAVIMRSSAEAIAVKRIFVFMVFLLFLFVIRIIVP